MTLKKSLLILVLALWCVLPVMAQDATEQPTIEATLGPTATSLADLTAAPSAEATIDLTLAATLESAAETTTEITAEVTAEATTEATVESAAEATVEATPDSAESETTATEGSSNPGIPIIVLLGGLGMLALAGGAIWWQDRDPETEIN